MAKLLLMKVTSRGRPEVLLSTIREYVRLAVNLKDMNWVYSFDQDDEKYNNEDFQLKLKRITPECFILFKASDGKINAINRDVMIINWWDILVNISDDQIPVVRGYDDIIRESMPDDLDSSLWFSDGWQDRINTQEIQGYYYYKRLGYIYNPKYKSFFCDNEATEIAMKLGKMFRSPQCIIKHFHPQWMPNSHIKRDALYIRNDAHWNHDKEVYRNRVK